MCTTQPIKSYEDIEKLKNYFYEKGEYRNYLLVTVCLNTALRICDVLSLKWSDVLYPNNNVRTHITLTETKTGKNTVIKINKAFKSALKQYMKNNGIKNTYLFAGKKMINP